MRRHAECCSRRCACMFCLLLTLRSLGSAKFLNVPWAILVAPKRPKPLTRRRLETWEPSRRLGRRRHRAGTGRPLARSQPSIAPPFSWLDTRCSAQVVPASPRHPPARPPLTSRLSGRAWVRRFGDRSSRPGLVKLPRARSGSGRPIIRYPPSGSLSPGLAEPAHLRLHRRLVRAS